MVDLEVLKAHDCTQENLAQWLAIDPLVVPAKPEGPILTQDSEELKRHALIRRIRSRIQEGMNRNFSSFRVYYALDLAWNTPFRQVSPTLIQSFIDQDPNTDDVYKKIKDWGFTHLIDTKKDPKSGKDVKTFNLPQFFEVIVPLVRAYATIRWAKILNDRNQVPFFSYEPVRMTTPLSLRAGVITDRVQVMSEQYGHYDILKQSVLKMLHYSFCFQMPKEEWHSEEQVRLADDHDVEMERLNTDGETAKVGDEIKVTSREGLRYHHPHPTRTFYDLAHGPYTFNYDSGCEYAGYWRIARYREIAQSSFWNKDKVALGAVDFMALNPMFFTSVYSSCQLSLPLFVQPKSPDGPVLAAEVGVGTTANDREKAIATQFYGTEHGDQGVLVTEYFEKLIPKDNGLGDYDCPVWFRFVVAGDCATVLYAAPLPYCPIVYYGYDADESQAMNPSLSLEIMPFQDQFSNVLSQILLTSKQNLANLTLLDEDQITPDAIKKVQNIGEGFYRFLNIMGFSGKKAFRGQNRVADAVQNIALPKGNVAELINVLRTILDVLERVLVMSSQEVAQAASHELRVDEVRNIQQSTSSRLMFTATPVDIAIKAWKRQLYEGLMAYGDEDFYTHLPAEIPLSDEILTAMGFTFVDPDSHTPKDRFRRARIKKSMTAIPIWELASGRDGDERTDKTKIAQVMGLILQNMLGNPMLAQAIGPDQALDLCNLLWKLAGLPPDKKLRNMAPAASPEQQQQQAQAQLKQVVDTVLQQVNTGMQQELVPLLDAVKQQGSEIAMIFKALNLNVPNPTLQNDNGFPSGPANGAGPQNPRMAPPNGVPTVPGLS